MYIRVLSDARAVVARLTDTIKKGGNSVTESSWVVCPACYSKTRIKICAKTIVNNLPLYCPKCKQENWVDIKDFKITIIKEPDAKTQSR